MYDQLKKIIPAKKGSRYKLDQLSLINILLYKIYYVTISLYFFEVMHGFDKTIKCFTLLFNDFATCLARQSYDAVVVPGL